MHEMTKNLAKVTFQDSIEKDRRASQMSNESRKQERTKLKSANQAYATLLGVAKTRNNKIMKKNQMPLEKIEETFEKNGLIPQDPLSEQQLNEFKPTYTKPTLEKEDLNALLKQIKPIPY